VKFATFFSNYESDLLVMFLQCQNKELFVC